MTVTWGPGMHAPRGRRVDGSAYAQYIGRWSRLFVPALLAAAEIRDGNRVLDVATGRARQRNWHWRTSETRGLWSVRTFPPRCSTRHARGCPTHGFLRSFQTGRALCSQTPLSTR